MYQVALTADHDAYNAWFKQKVFEALADERPTISHQNVMVDVQVMIDRKSHDRVRMDSNGSKKKD